MSKYMDDCIKLCNFIMPQLKIILSRQRWDYGISQAFEAQFSIYEQAANIDDTPVTNMAMERLFGKVDYRLHKLKQLKVVSRSLILQQTEQHRKDYTAKTLEIILNKLYNWENWKWYGAHIQKKNLKVGATEKQAIAMIQEHKHLELLHKLKLEGGPFTCADEVDLYMLSNDSGIVTKEKNENGNSVFKKLLKSFTKDWSTL